ncbi:MAG: SDR family NAD(P)-dependent oxidoreductase [Thermomicrobiales bacterium]
MNINNTQFENRVVLVTGAGSGIGRATAIELATRGAKVGVCSRSEANIAATIDEIERAGGTALSLIADVNCEEDINNAFAKLDATWGRLDGVVVNAGVNGVWAPIAELTLDEWNTTISTNLTSTFLTTKAALPLLKRQGGSIAITASVNGTRIFSNTGASAYSTSKAGQVAFAKMAALELARDKIRVNVVCPGWISTNIGDATYARNLASVKIPVNYPEGSSPLAGGPGSAESVAKLFAFLLSDDSSHISGTEMWIDGTESLLIG